MPQAQQSAPTPNSTPDFIPHVEQQATPDFIPHQEARTPDFIPHDAIRQADADAQSPFPQWLESGLETANKVVQVPVRMGEALGHFAGQIAGGYPEQMQQIAGDQNQSPEARQYAQHQQQRIEREQQQHPIARGLGQAGAEFAGNMAGNPTNWPLMLSGFGNPMANRAMSAGFGLQMGYGAVDKAGQLGQQWDTAHGGTGLTGEEKTKGIAEVGLDTIMAGQSGGHALRPEPARISDSGRQTGGQTTQRQPVAPQQIDPQLQRIQDFARANMTREGAGQPTIKPAAQMGGDAVAKTHSAAPTPPKPEPTMAAGPQELAKLGETPDQTATRAIAGGSLNPQKPAPTLESAKATMDQQLKPWTQRLAESEQQLTPRAEAGDPAAQQQLREQFQGRRKQDVGPPSGQPERRFLGNEKPVPGRAATIPEGLGKPAKPRDKAPTQPFKLPERKPDTTKAFPDRRIGEQATDLDSLLKSQVARGDITREEAARILAKRAGQTPDPSKPGFRYSSLSDAEKAKLGDLSARTPAAKEAAPTETPATPRESVSGTAAPESSRAAREPVHEPQRLAGEAPRTPAEAPKSPVDATSDDAYLKSLLAPGKTQDPRVLKAIPRLVDAVQKLPEQSRRLVGETARKEFVKALREGKSPTEATERALKHIEAKKAETGFGSFFGKKDPNAKTAAAGKRVSRKLDMTLSELGSQAQADYRRAYDTWNETKASVKDRAQVAHHMENPKEPLTPAQQKHLDEDIRPYKDEADRIRQKLDKRGVTTDEPGVHRIVQQKGSKLERAFLGHSQYSSGAKLSKSASGLKARTMFALEDPSVGRIVVAKHGDDVIGFHNKQEIPLGSAEALEASGAKFKQATMKEIEAHTKLKYFHDALASTTLDALELRRAERASDALEDIKLDPDFKKIAMQEGKGTPGKGWKTTSVPQLRGYSFEPQVAEVLDRYWSKFQKGEPGGWEKLNEILRTSIFMLPLRHIKNIANHAVVQKGVTGLLPHKWPIIVKTGLHAINTVMHPGGEEFLSHQDMGAPLQSQRNIAHELNSLMVAKMAKEIEANPSKWAPISKAFEMAHPLNLVKAVYNLSTKATFVFDDILRLQASYQHMAEHKTDFTTAYKEVGKHLPDYRIPTRILGSRWLSEKVMDNPDVTMFGAYHYGMLKSYAEMAKDIVGKESSPAERAKALDRLAALALVTFGFYNYVADPLARKLTGHQNARVERSGASTFWDNLSQVFQGKKGAFSAGAAVVTPSPLLGIGMEAAGNLRRPEPLKKQVITAGKDILEKVGPINQTNALKKGKMDWKRIFYDLVLGIRYPDASTRSRGLSLPKISLRR